VILTRNDKFVSRFLVRFSTTLLDSVTRLIFVGNCLVQKQLLALLHDVIVLKGRRKILMQYLANEQYILSYMSLIKNNAKNRKSIALAAWHIFKLFVNEPKNDAVRSVLMENRHEIQPILLSLRNCNCEVRDPSFDLELKKVLKGLDECAEAKMMKHA